jgi:N-hydroxyarylamine O-acetyltransferase
VRARRPADAEVAAAHRMLSTPPDGRFTQVLVVLRRDDTGAEALREIRHQRTGDGAFTRDLASYDDRARRRHGPAGPRLRGVTAAAGRSLPAGNFNPRITKTFFCA